MTRVIRSVLLLILIAAVGLAVLPAAANITGSSASISPGNVTAGETLDITFDVTLVSDDLDYMDRFDVELPAAWTINSITPNSGNDEGEECPQDGVAYISGQTLIWEDGSPGDLCGPWPFGGLFTANVTVNSCDGAPWSLPYHISSDEWSKTPPFDVYDNITVTCEGGVVETPEPDPSETPVPDVAATPAPGCDAMIAIPDGAVGAVVLSDARVYWKPGAVTEHVLTAGTTLRAIGLDAGGEYYQVLYGCDFLWVKAATLGPNYDEVWNGAPLPTTVIEVETGTSRR